MAWPDLTWPHRYIIVLFMGYDTNRMSGREAGYVRQRFDELLAGGDEAAATRMGASKIAPGAGAASQEEL